jgi:hypothetical protein
MTRQNQVLHSCSNAALAFFLATKERADVIDQMETLLLGEQTVSSFMMFNTSYSYTNS